MPICNRRELLIRVGLVRPPMISAEQKARFVAACMSWNPRAFSEMHQDRKSTESPNVWALIGAVALCTMSWIALVGAAMAWL